MQEDKKQWQLGINQPFQGGRQKFASIPKSKRSQFIKKMLLTQQLSIPPPYRYQKPYQSQSTFKYKQYDLHVYSIQNTPNPQAILIIIHGVNSNGKVFGYFANKIAEKNHKLNIYAFDQMNFGKSKGNLRGYIDSLDDNVNQAEQFVSHILNKFQNKPKIFLCGHSFGGTISFKMTLKKPNFYQGVIFLTPGFRDIAENLYYTKQIMKFIGWIKPNYTIEKSPPPGLGTKYNLRQKFANDPDMITGIIVFGTIRAVMNGIGQISQLYDKFSAPYLCIAAGVEKLLDPFAPLDFEEKSASKDKKVIYCQNMWHVITEEEEIEGVSWHCAEWLKQRISN